MGAAVALLLIAAALPLGGRAFGFAVAVAAGIALLAITAAVDAVGPRPVVLAAAVAGVGTPLRLALEPGDGLSAIPPLAAAMLLTCFVLLMVARRRSNITATLGATVFTGLLVGLGTGGLLVLRLDRHGFRWTLGLLALCVLPNLASLVAARVRPATAGADQAVRAVVLAAIAGALAAAANPPFTLPVAAGGAVIAFVADHMAGLLQRFAGPAPAAGTPLAPAPDGLAWFGPLLLAAPVVALAATVVQS
jgi:hypothetical protein